MEKEEQIIKGFRDVLNKMILLNKVKMEELLKGYKSSEVHCIQCIGKNEDANVTKLAESFYMTRGAISKVTKKLIAKGILESYQKPENKKEVYYRLTEQGNVIFEIHENLHQEFCERDKAIFEQVTDEQLEAILGFTQNYTEHLDTELKKQGITVKPETLE